jgi:hypothetical protein
LETIRKKLKGIADNPNNLGAVAAGNSLLQDFQERWRASDVPMSQNTVERATRNRQVGIHPVLLILARTAATV